MNANLVIAKRLHVLAELYQQGQISEMMERSLKKLFSYEAGTCQMQLQQLQSDLSAFEQQYHLASDEFYRQYQVGQMGDEMDYIEWASLVQMAQNLLYFDEITQEIAENS